MKQALTTLIVGLIVGGFVGWYSGYRAADKSWQQRAITGVSVDCYDAQGNFVPDTWGEKFGAVRMSCPPGQTARIHQAKAQP